MNVTSKRTDLFIDTKRVDDDTFFFSTVKDVKEKFKSKFTQHFKKYKNVKSVLVVGLGSRSHTADSIGPKTIDYITANGYLIGLGINLKRKIYTLEPGVLGKTGIDTKRIVESVVDEIKPDLVVLIDSFVTSNVDNLEHTIEINDRGVTPGSGILGLNSQIDEKSIGRPVIVIGVPTGLEIELNSKKREGTLYLLSTSRVDVFVDKISKIIGTSINEILYQE